MPATSSTTAKKKKKGARVPFPQRLFHLLKLAEENGWEDIVSWVNDGTGFKVHDRVKFEELLLQKHFNTTRYASFARQLHAYDFDCVRTGRQTGIYSHPDFKRDDPETSCSLKREASKTISKKAISKHNNDQNHQQTTLPFSNFSQGIRAGDTIVQFPSLLKPNLLQEDESSLSNSDSSQSSGVARLYNTVRTQVADQTRRTLIRIPSEAPENPFHNPENAFWSLSSTSRIGAMMANNNTSEIHTTGNTAGQDLSTTMANMTNNVSSTDSTGVSSHDDTNTTHDNTFFDPMPLLPENDADDDLMFQDDDLEPIPWSPLENPPGDDDDDSYKKGDSIQDFNELDASLEPRPIHEMVQHPANPNEWWYDSCPMFGTPRKRALLEFSLPLSLPVGFYLLDVSTFGICWVCFLILGHFVECLFTSWGGADDEKDKTYTKDLNIQPFLGMLQHHIMDLLWFHFLLSNMILTPQYFGPPCFPLIYLFTWPQPFNLCIVIKTHYCESNLEGTYSHGKWWIGDLVKNVLVGYFLTILGVFLLHYYGMDYLRIPLVFGFNMIPLFIFESYRYLVSIPTILVVPRRGGVSDVKKRN
mmetsp:Transcript_39983/g.96478  ORF Transcript_39983/g.96478 Transcript_39983/m.96478 type:complete len:586 (+) Transcript_39983:152-1909(+)